MNKKPIVDPNDMFKDIPVEVSRHYREKERRIVKSVKQDGHQVIVEKTNGTTIWAFENNRWRQLIMDQRSIDTIMVDSKSNTPLHKRRKLFTKIDCIGGRIYINVHGYEKPIELAIVDEDLVLTWSKKTEPYGIVNLDDNDE